MQIGRCFQSPAPSNSVEPVNKLRWSFKVNSELKIGNWGSFVAIDLADRMFPDKVCPVVGQGSNISSRQIDLDHQS